MLILGLDPSQKTGWALYDTKAPLSAIRCGVLKIAAEKKAFERNAGLLGRALVKLLGEHRDPNTKKIILPDFAVIEKAPRQPAGQYGQQRKPTTVKFMGEEVPAQDGDEAEGGGGLQSTLSTNQMAAALCAVLGAYGIPYEALMSSGWRKSAYGFGTHKGWKREDWKKYSRQMCQQMRITATNDDMAEACWIAFAGKACGKFKEIERNRLMQAQRAA
jgi:hypothetical protein